MKIRTVAVIALLVIVTFSGCISDDNPQIDPDVVEVDIEMVAEVSSDISFWEMELSISGNLSAELYDVKWSNVKVGVEGPDGEELLEPSAPVPLPEDIPNDIGVYYLADPGATRIVNGTSIVITGIDRSFEGSILRLYKGDTLVAKSMPAPNLPPLSLAIKLGEPVIGETSMNDTSWWGAVIPIQGVTPLGEVVNWSEASARIVDGDTEEVLLESNLSSGQEGDGPRMEAVDADGEGQIDDEDYIDLKNLTLAYEGATVQLIVNGSVVGSKDLTDEFPISIVRVRMHISLGDYMIGNQKYWFMNVSHISIWQPPVTPSWDEMEVRMVSGEPDPGNDLIERTELEKVTGSASSTLQVGYLELGGTEGSMDTQDMILVRGMNLSFSNSSFELWWRGKAVGSVQLPYNLNFTDYRNVTLNLAYPDVKQIQAGSTTVWRAILNINKITPKTARVFWEDIEIKIIQETGSVLIHPQSVKEDQGEYDQDDSDGIDVELWYVETGVDDRMSAGDAFKLTGLSVGYESATIEVYGCGYLIGSSILPTNFP